MEKDFLEVQRGAHCGDKIMITEINNYHQLLCGLFKVGNVLTVKTLNERFPRYPYGSENGYHIKEVLELATPKGIEILIHPRQSVVLEENATNSAA